MADQESVLKEQVKFFTKPYSQEAELVAEISEKVSKFTENESFPKLNEVDRNRCEGKINCKEAGNALRTMKNGSYPGGDDLTVEFITFFWKKIKTVVVKSFNESFEKGEMSYTQRLGIIVLIPKDPDLPQYSLSNWRPITLTNTDYKVLAKVLAMRLSRVIGH